MTTREVQKPFDPILDAGCWYDSHRGYTGISYEIIMLATEYGMIPEDFKEGDESFDWESERAEQFLSNLAPEGFWIGWNDGDFGMYPIEED